MLWSVKLHAESVMAMAVSRDNLLALTVSVDHLIGKYDLVSGANAVYRTKHPGNGSVAIRGDGKVCAIGGWDGSIRLYSTKSFKSLGTLDYHKGACQAITFASVLAGTRDTAEADNEDGMSVEEEEARSRWLIGGEKEGRVSIWKLMDFEGKKR
jgi:WD40 repeat protein